MSSWGPIALFLISLPVVADEGDFLETTIGMEGTYYLRCSGVRLEAKPVNEGAPVLLRVNDVVEDNGSLIYELRYLGLEAGTHDLREYLRRVDGQPMTVRPFQKPIPVRVRAVLPEDHDGALEKLASPPGPGLWPYRTWIVAAVLLWLLPAGFWLRHWLRRPRPSKQTQEVGSPTLADQLRPLVEAALEGRLSTGDKARLELLLIAHWRDRLSLTGPTLATLHGMREHREAGEVLRRLEDWLHRPPGKVEADVHALLEPYRSHAPVDLKAQASTEAPS